MINIYSAAEAKLAADTFYSPLSQIFDAIRSNAQDGLYVLQVHGIELNSKQIEVLSRSGYAVDPSVDAQDRVVYTVSWS